MHLSGTGIGSEWAPGLPPGVYEEPDREPSRRDVRLDASGFLGLADRGPLAVPVPITSYDTFLRLFGAPGGGRLLASSIQLFFQNGGRKAVVLRVADADAARTARWHVPALKHDGAPFVLDARSPGRWGNRLQIRGSFARRRLHLARPSAVPLDPNEAVAASAAELEPGDLLRLATDTGPAAYRFVESLMASVEGERVRFEDPIPPEALLETAKPGADPADRVLVADVVSLNLALSVDPGAAHGLSETWNGLSLHPAHSRFFARVLGERAWSERFAWPEPLDPSRPDHHQRVERDANAVLLPLDPRRAGSELVRPTSDGLNRTYHPDDRVIVAGGQFELGPLDLDNIQQGSDGEASTSRDHFFTAPQIGPYAGQPEPLEAIERYDNLNETEPVSLVAAPDLLHPRQYDDTEPGADAAVAADATRFRDCAIPVAAPADVVPVRVYPLLVQSHDSPGLQRAHRRLIDWCEMRGEGLAILDLPPGQTAGDIVNWRRELVSDRAALYAPYVEADDPTTGELDRLIIPPCGAACGIIARREASIAVHAAPANEDVRGVLRLFDDPRLPDAGFLFSESINELRVTERGIDLLGARTLTRDRDWVQVSVRRLIDYLKRQITLDCRWAVFEPNNRALWRRLSRTVESRLVRLHSENAFAGRTRETSFFVRIDDSTNSGPSIDRGELTALVGVAPALPMEFVVFRLTRIQDGQFEMEERRD